MGLNSVKLDSNGVGEKKFRNTSVVTAGEWSSPRRKLKRRNDMEIIQWANKEGWTIKGDEDELIMLELASAKARRESKAICQTDKPIEIELEF